MSINWHNISERTLTEEELTKQHAIINAINAVFKKALTCEGEEVLAQTCLEVIEDLTGSKFGFIGEINQEGRFDIIAISNPGWDACKMPESEATKLIKNMELRGIWSLALKNEKSYIINDPKSHPASIGMPKGHPILTSFMGVPLKQAGRTFGMIALGNKESSYDQHDQEAVEALSGAIVEALARKRAEIKLEKYRDNLEKLVEERSHNLKERIKELTCLYQISNLVQKSDISFKQVFTETLEFLRHAWQFPDVTCARIIFKDNEFKTSNFIETRWRLNVNIKVNQKKIGFLEVYYLKEMPVYEEGPFLKEEKNLINGIVKILEGFVERRKTEKKLEESEERYRELYERFRSLVETTSDWIWEVDENAIYTYASPKVKDLLGYEPEEIIGKTPFDLMPPNEAERVRSTFQSISQSQKSFMGLENINLHKDGRLLVLETSGVPIIGENGNFRGYRGIDRDITKRKKAEEKLERFVSTVSHELRTPISVLMMSTDYMIKHKGTLLPEIEEKLCNGVLRNVSLLNDLVEDILLLSRIDEKRKKLDLKAYCPLEIVQEVLFLMESRLKEKEITAKLDIDKAIILYGDIKRIDQVFRIFIDNAIKYSKDKTEIEIVALDNYKGKYNPKQVPGVLFQFKDNGIGISEKDFPHLFERFFRSEQVTDIPGTGLGLAIAKELTALHKGKIFVESEYDKGSTFSLFLPKIEEH